MKTILPFVSIFIIALVLPYITGWWSLPILVGIASYFYRLSVTSATIMGFFAVFFAWIALTFWLNGKFDSPIADVMGVLLGDIGASKVHILTGLLGGILGGLGGLCGSLLIAMLHPQKLAT